MSSAPLIAGPNATRQSRASNLTRRGVLDLGAGFLTAAISLAIGLLMNRFSVRPLLIVYQTPEQRLDAEPTSLIVARPLALAPAATIGLAQFRSAVESKKALILDARSSSFFIQGHVPSARDLARDDFAHDYQRLSGILKAAGNKPIIVYCSGGACHDSRLVANALLTLGFDNFSVFTGGWEEWSAARLPMSTGIVR